MRAAASFSRELYSIHSTVGALIIRIGFWGFLIIVIVYNISPNPILIVS